MPKLAKETFKILRVTTSPVASSTSMTSSARDRDIKESGAGKEMVEEAPRGTKARGEDEAGDRDLGRRRGEGARRLRVEEGEGDRREEYRGEGERRLPDCRRGDGGGMYRSCSRGRRFDLLVGPAGFRAPSNGADEVCEEEWGKLEVEPEEMAEVATDGEIDVGVEMGVEAPVIEPLGGIRRPGRTAWSTAEPALSLGRGW